MKSDHIGEGIARHDIKSELVRGWCNAATDYLMAGTSFSDTMNFFESYAGLLPANSEDSRKNNAKLVAEFVKLQRAQRPFRHNEMIPLVSLKQFLKDLPQGQKVKFSSKAMWGEWHGIFLQKIGDGDFLVFDINDGDPSPCNIRAAYWKIANAFFYRDKLKDSILLGVSSRVPIPKSKQQLTQGQLAEALIRFAHLGDLEEVIAILNKNNIDVNYRDMGGETVLISASKAGRLKIVRKLLEIMPDIDVNQADDKGRTPLIAAVASKQPQIVRELSKMPGINVNQADDKDMTPLIAAVANGILEVVRELLKMPGINVNQADDKDMTPLMAAVASGNLEVVRELLKMPGINVNQAMKDVTPLMMAVESRNLEVVRELVGVPGINVNQAGMYGMTALKLALENRSWKIARVLTENMDPNSRRSAIKAIRKHKLL